MNECCRQFVISLHDDEGPPPLRRCPACNKLLSITWVRTHGPTMAVGEAAPQQKMPGAWEKVEVIALQEGSNEVQHFDVAQVGRFYFTKADWLTGEPSFVEGADVSEPRPTYLDHKNYKTWFVA